MNIKMAIYNMLTLSCCFTVRDLFFGILSYILTETVLNLKWLYVNSPCQCMSEKSRLAQVCCTLCLAHAEELRVQAVMGMLSL